MQKVDLPIRFAKLNENCGLPNLFTDYQIRHLGNPSGLPEILTPDNYNNLYYTLFGVMVISYMHTNVLSLLLFGMTKT